MKHKIVVTGGAIIRDHRGRILLQRRSDYGNWGLPGGGMEPGEAIEETMIREVYEETGLAAERYQLHSIYSGSRMQYRYPDGNEVYFVMFLFDVEVDLTEKLAADGATLLYRDEKLESLQLQFRDLMELDIEEISTVQRPAFEDLIQQHRKELLRQ